MESFIYEVALYSVMKGKNESKWEKLEKSVEDIRNDPETMKLLDELIKFHTS